MTVEIELKEFFYVDVDRVRSLLAQLQGGLVEVLKSESSKLYEAPAGALGPRSRSERVEEARSFQEMLFVAFEHMASDAGWVTDLDESVRDPERWSEGLIHKSLRPGQLLRLQCDVQVLDGKLFGERLQRFEKMTEAVVELSDQAIPSNATAKQRTQLLETAKNAIRGGITTAHLNAIAGFVGDFVGDAVAIRFMPCGVDHIDYGFSGALLNRRDYIQEEREHLFSRYGTVAASWTCFVQVAAIPTFPEEGADDSTEDPPTNLTGDSSINRAAMEKLATQLLVMMESVGIVEGPRWPSISVTPLGIYRTVPKPGVST